MSVHLELTPKILAQLRFDTAIDASGKPVGPTPKGVREWVIRDTGVRGMLLRLTPRTSTWYVQRKVMGMPMRRAMGHWWSADEGFRPLSLTDARKRAKIWLGMMEQGLDPLVEKKKRQREAKDHRTRDALTFSLAYEAYVDGKARKAKTSTTTDRRKVVKWMAGSPLWSMPVADIDVTAVAATFDPLFRAVTDGTRLPPWGPKSLSAGTLSKLYAYCAAAYARAAVTLALPSGKGVGPFSRWREDQRWPKAEPKHSYLPTGSAVGQSWLKGLVQLHERSHAPEVLADRADPRGDAIKPHLSVLVDYILCVLLWGTRKEETARLQWEHVDFERGYVVFPAGITKSGKAGIAPLTPWAASILQGRKASNVAWRPGDTSPWVFPSRQHGKPVTNARSVLLTLQREAGLWITAHDLRRTMATDLGRAKVHLEQLGRLIMVGAALNHTRSAGSVVPSAVTQDYIQEQADLLRPHYLEREARLRLDAGIEPPLASKDRVDSETAAEIWALLKGNKALRAEVLASLEQEERNGLGSFSSARVKNESLR